MTFIECDGVEWRAWFHGHLVYRGAYERTAKYVLQELQEHAQRLLKKADPERILYLPVIY